MSKKKLSKLLALYLPYVVIGLVATNLGEAWRLAAGKELGDKIVSLMDTLPAAFSNPLPSLHLFDLFIGLCCGAGMRLAVYLKGKNAKKYRHALMKNKIIGVCPNCGKPVVEREKGWFCENRECRFVLWKDNAFLKRLGKRMDAHVADKLLRDGRVRLKDCKSAKGKTYNATVLLSCEADGRSKFSLEFEGGC